MLPPDRAIVLISVAASGTERRMAFVFTELCRRYPGRYLLIINRELYDILQQAGFALDRYERVIHILENRSRFDTKRGAHPGLVANVARTVSLWRYRAQIAAVVRTRQIATLQVFLEMVPFLGIVSLNPVKMIASLVSHLPKYYDPGSWSCRLLLRSLRAYQHVDALYEVIGAKLTALGVPPSKITFPRHNCVDHQRFAPAAKDRVVTFTARFFDFKNPLLMIEAAERIVRRAPEVRVFILGQGPLAEVVAAEVQKRRLGDAVVAGYFPDPSPIVNRSLIHVCLEQYDNATNQSLLEGMAAGCAIVASSVGMTSTVVGEDIGVLVDFDPEAIAAAVISVLDRPQVAERMGQAARNRVLKEHNVAAYVEYLHGVHDQVMYGVRDLVAEPGR